MLNNGRKTGIAIGLVVFIPLRRWSFEDQV